MWPNEDSRISQTKKLNNDLFSFARMTEYDRRSVALKKAPTQPVAAVVVNEVDEEERDRRRRGGVKKREPLDIEGIF
jgi:hypothetical protein